MATAATIPIASMAVANDELFQAGFGPGNFSVPMRSGASDATHASLHLGGRNDAFLAALQAMTYPGLVIEHDGTTTRNWDAHVTSVGLEWVQTPEGFALGAVRSSGGKNWESQIDGNVWPIPIGWREVGVDPEWVQPSGVADAYPKDFGVTWVGRVWDSDYPANVWEPGVFGWTERVPPTDAWFQPSGAGDAFAIGAEVTHPNAQDGGNVWLFRSKIPANTTEPGTDGEFHRWWEPVAAV